MLGPGRSSASIWTPFASMTTATYREVRGRVYVAWTRVADVSAFARVGTSIVNGTDIVQGDGDTAVNLADAFYYFDETDSMIRLEYERHLIEPLGGMSIAMADVILDNTDLRFTSGYDPSIGTSMRPNRPVKMFIGFHVEGQDKLIPIIEGLTLTPQEDKVNRTLKLTIYDYLKWLNEKPQETTIYENKRTDEIIADILSRAGVGDSAYQLDQSLNTVGFAWFEKGQTAGDRIKLLCEAEEAIFYQDETGVMHFDNRDKYSQSPYNSVVWTIEPEDVLEWYQDRSSEIINRAIVKGSPRTVKAEAEIWRDGIEEEIGASGSLTIWASFEDPAYSLVEPVGGTDYKVFTESGGTGVDITSDVTITLTSFTKSAKLVINNANAAVGYITLLKLRGTPATVDYEIEEVIQDTTSINNYNEYQKEISNPFIDNRRFARNMATNIIRRHKEQQNVIRLKVRGIPQLQLRDQVRVKDYDLNVYKNYRVISIQGVLDSGGFVQTLRLREITSAEAL